MAFKMKGFSPFTKKQDKQTTDREAMRAAARKKNKENSDKMNKVLERKGEYAEGPMEYKEVYGTYQKPGGLPRAPKENAPAHTMRKVATWLGVDNKKNQSKK